MNMSFLQELFSNITQREALLRRRVGNGLTVDHSHLLDACRALLESDGEASSITHASHALEIYSRLDDDSKKRFFEQLGVESEGRERVLDLVRQPGRHRAELRHPLRPTGTALGFAHADDAAARQQSHNDSRKDDTESECE